MTANQSGIRLTKGAIDKLWEEGYRYFHISGYTLDGHIELHFLLLTPVVDLPSELTDMEIYAPLDGKLMLDWAKGEDEVLAYIDENFVR